MRFVTLIGIAFALVAGSCAAAEPIRITIVTGGHSYSLSFYKLFDYEDYRVMVEPHPTQFRATSRGGLAQRCDVLVLYDIVQEDAIGAEGQKNLRAYVEAGKGLIVLHHGVLDYTNWEWWTREVSGISRKPPGEPTRRDQPTDGADMALQVVTQHPLLDGVGLTRITDEAYKNFWISPRNTILLRTDNPASDGPVAWIGPSRKARVFVTTLGHGPEAHMNPGFQRLMRNAVLWTAGRLN